jgi:hypothetical protein
MSAAVEPFERMLPQEQRHHLEEVHGIPDQFPDRLLAGRSHTQDHKLIDYPHIHDDRTCHGYGPAPENDDTLYCEACGDPVEERDAQCPTLCPRCAATIDEKTDLYLEEQFFDPGLD